MFKRQSGIIDSNEWERTGSNRYVHTYELSTDTGAGGDQGRSVKCIRLEDEYGDKFTVIKQFPLARPVPVRANEKLLIRLSMEAEAISV